MKIFSQEIYKNKSEIKTTVTKLINFNFGNLQDNCVSQQIAN